MAASESDKFIKVGKDRFSTTLASTKNVGAASASLSDATDLPTDTGIIITVYDLDTSVTPAVPDTSTAVSYAGTLSGTTVSNLNAVSGTDRTHDSGATVIVTLTAEHIDRLVEGLTAEHSQLDGTHTDITADSIVVADAGTLEVDTINEATAANGVTVDGLNIKDSKLVTADSVVEANITDGAVTGEKLGQPVAFSARLSANQTLTSGATTLVQHASEVYDYGGNYDHTTYRFTAPYDGVYHIDVRGNVDAAGDGKHVACFIYVNGAEYARDSQWPGTNTADQTAAISMDIGLTAGDYVEHYFYQVSGANRALIGSSTLFTSFSGHLVGRTD